MGDPSTDAISKVNIISSTYTWNLTDVKLLFDLPDGLLSPILLFDNKSDSSISYQISIKMRREKCSDYYASNAQYVVIETGVLFHNCINIDMFDGSPLQIKYTYINSEGISVVEHAAKMVLVGLKNFRIKEENFVDPLTLTCTLSYGTYTTSYSAIDEVKDFQRKDTSKTTKELTVLPIEFKEISELSDMTIYVQKKPFYVHACILSCYPYFENLLLEAKSLGRNEIYVDDIEYDVFKYILHYIYTGDDKDLMSIIYKSVLIVEKFGIRELEEKYVRLLKKEMTLTNLIDTLTIACEISNQSLISDIKAFIVKNIICIKKDQVYNELKVHYPDILMDILKHYMTT